MKKLTTSLITFGFFSLLTLAAIAESDIIHYVDDQGKTHLVDDIEKVPSKYQNQIKRFDFAKRENDAAKDIDEIVEEEVVAYDGPSIVGQVLANGKLLTDSSEKTPTFKVRNISTGEIEEVETTYDEGQYTIAGLEPGNYSIATKVDIKRSSIADDLVGTKRVVVPQGSAAQADIRLSKLVQLEKRPTRSARSTAASEPLNYRCKDKGRFQGPLQFNWSALEDGATYNYTVHKASCSPQALGDVVANGSTTASSVTINLNESGSNDFYYLRINGRDSASALNDGYWEFRFRIDQAYGRATNGVTLVSSK